MSTQKNMKKILIRLIIIIPCAILLASGIAVLGYFTFFPAKMKLMIAGYNSTVKLYNCIDKNIDLLMNRYFTPRFESTVREERRLGLSLNEKFLTVFITPEEAEALLPHINRLELGYESQLNIKNRKHSSELWLSYFLNTLLTARLSVDGNRFGFGVDELSNKTVAGEMSDLGRLSYFFPEIPEEFWDAAENTDPWIWAKTAEQVEFDRKALKKAMTGYFNEIMSSVGTRNITGSRYKTEVLGDETACFGVIIRLDENDQKELVSKIIGKLKEDDFVYGITAGNIKKALDILGENEYYRELVSGYGLADAFGRDDYIRGLSRLEEEILSASLPELTIRIYIDGLDIVKYSFDFGAKEDTAAGKNTPDPAVVIEQRINGPSFQLAISSYCGIDNGYPAYLYVKRDHNADKDLNGIEMRLNMGDTVSRNDNYCSVSIKSSETEKSRNEKSHIIDASLEYGMPYLLGEGKLGLSLEGTIKKDSGKQTTKKDYKGRLTFLIPFVSSDEQSIGFYYDTKTIYGEKVVIPEPDDVLDLKTATDEDFEMLIDEVYDKINALMRLAGF